MTQEMILVDIPQTSPLHVGEFHWNNGDESFSAEFHVNVPADDSHPSSRSWRENLLNIQLMMAWEELIEKGYRNIQYKSLHPHPIF